MKLKSLLSFLFFVCLTGNVFSQTDSVALSIFNAIQQPTDVKINWQTIKEKNADFFSIFRSLDSITFNNIGDIPASGNSDSIRNYQFNDYSAPHPDTCKFYKLRTYFYDGYYKYSNRIKICFLTSVNEVELDNSFSVYPNPSSGKFTIENKSPATTTYETQISNIMGEEIYQKKSSGESFQIDISGQPNGIYFLRVKTSDGVATKKIIVNK